MGLALVTRIPSLVEAEIACGALRSGGIDAQVFDGNFGRVEAPVIEALGGYRLMAPEEQVIAAREALAMLRASPGLGEPDEIGPWSAAAATSSQLRSKRYARVFALILAVLVALAVIRFAVMLALTVAA